jgi:hypothetical protein
MGIPYTYRITHLPSGRHYYGARYAKDCHPCDLWAKYFTSSKVVKKLIEQDGKEAFSYEVRRTFKTVGECIDWEHKVLCRLKVHRNNSWLNLHTHKSREPKDNQAIMLKKYGVAHAMQISEVRQKIKATNMDRYGVEHNSQSKVFQEKCKATNLERLGYEYAMKNPYIKQKAKATNLEKYGCENPMQNSDVARKVEASIEAKYGVKNYFMTEEGRRKAGEWHKTAPLKICNKCGYSSRESSLMERHHFDNCSWIDVVCVETGRVFNNMQELEEHLRTFKKGEKLARNVLNACRGRRKTSYGYHWKFAEPSSTTDTTFAVSDPK